MEEGKGIDHQSAVDPMTRAIGRLLPRLVELLKQEHNLQTSSMSEALLEALETQLRRMEYALVRMHKHCSYKLRELSYDIQDSVDILILLIDEGRLVRRTYLTLDPRNLLLTHSSRGTTLENIKVRVENLAAWHLANFVPTMTTITVNNPCVEDWSFMQVRQLVGIHKLKAELISSVSSSSQQLRIVSIWGAGGMGKTTLAKAVYENIKGNFQGTAFVSVGPQRDSMKQALKDILIHLDKPKYRDLNMTILDERQLIDELRHFLENKRFLIVIDHIWNLPSWEVIKRALVDNGCGSRIITTSRILGVAESSGEVLKLMPLSIDGSKELFYATLCSRKGTINFGQLDEQTTEYILQKCGCVPLAIIMIASLLAGKPQEEWTEVCNSIGFGHEDNIADENTRKIIQFSYNDLPSHLKTCLLYLTIFPDDDHVIEKDTLVWRWVAEGFVHDDQEQGESLFKVGERYLYELVSRSMIQAVEIENNIRACRVEGMVLECIHFEAQEQNFVNIESGDWYDDDDQHLFCRQSNNARMMAVHNGVLDEPHDLAGMWRSFNVTGCSISSKTLQHQSFQGLRVLSLEDCKLTAHSDGLKNLIERLLHLRYLGLRGTAIRDLPIGIGGLRYLQTLDLTKTYISELTSSVTQLRQLKCLRCFAPRLESPEGMGNLTSLEELRLGRVNKSPNFAKELSKLTKLRVLHIINKDRFHGKWMEALVESLSELQKIEELEIFCGFRGDKTCRHVIAPGGFPKMRHFRTNTWMMYRPGAMPCLKSIALQLNVRALKDANFDFHDFYKFSYLRLLEKVRVAINCRKAKMEEVEEVEAALRRVLESHPNHPKLILARFGQCVDEGDIQIRFLGGLHGSGVAPQVMPLEILRRRRKSV